MVLTAIIFRKHIPKWGKSDWQEHTKILKKLAKHKVIKTAAKTVRFNTFKFIFS